jgi:tetratricopeptide (TPR) repeat protein
LGAGSLFPSLPSVRSSAHTPPLQLGLYHVALGHTQHAIDAFQKALFINPDDVPASVHMCRLYLTPEGSSRTAEDEVDANNVDLVAGMLAHLTRGPGWDVPEAWYFLAKAYGMQDRKDRARECLSLALQLSEQRGVREAASAVGWCI